MTTRGGATLAQVLLTRELLSEALTGKIYKAVGDVITGSSAPLLPRLEVITWGWRARDGSFDDCRQAVSVATSARRRNKKYTLRTGISHQTLVHWNLPLDTRSFLVH